MVKKKNKQKNPIILTGVDPDISSRILITEAFLLASPFSDLPKVNEQGQEKKMDKALPARCLIMILSRMFLVGEILPKEKNKTKEVDAACNYCIITV